MDDDSFVQAFESCTLPPESFHHRDHIRLSWIYLRRMNFAAACDRMRASVLRFSMHHGAALKYHATLTLAWMCLVREASGKHSAADSFDQFLNASPELLTTRTLESFYSPEALASQEARERWIAPDRRALPCWP